MVLRSSAEPVGPLRSKSGKQSSAIRTNLSVPPAEQIMLGIDRYPSSFGDITGLVAESGWAARGGGMGVGVELVDCGFQVGEEDLGQVVAESVAADHS